MKRACNQVSAALLLAAAFLLPLSAAVNKPSATPFEPETTRIGVLAYRGKALARWSPTADYLSEQVPGHRFEIVPVNLDEMAEAIQSGKIHFTLTNPGNYVNLESRFGVSRIATLQTRERGRTRVRYGAVVIARADNGEVRTLHDLKGRSFMAVSPEAFGGFQMAWRELKQQGIDPFRDFSDLRFAGFPQDKIVLAVRAGAVDAATVRAETLARMVEAGNVELNEFRILNPQPLTGSAIPLSTRLYPEWPFATLKDTPRELASRVTRALLSMPADHPAAHSARTAGWTIPMDYSPVHELMRALRIGPYEVLRQTSPLAVIKRYAHWLIGAAVLLLALLLVNGYVSRTNHRLKETERSLRREILQRRRSQETLARYRDSLEEQVTARTEDLATTNQALEKSRVALRELVRIAGAPDLSHEQRLARLLETGRAYYGVPIAVLASVDGDQQRVCKVSGDTAAASGHPGPVDAGCAARLIALQGEPLDIPSLEQQTGAGARCLQRGWKSYLGAAVLVEGKVHCTLEFAGREAREEPLSQWDHELLRVMAQWIGDELERHIANDAQQRHQAELARVSRMSTIGEMAASLAHELNQPLTGAINYSSGCLRLLRSGARDDGKLTEGLERAVEGAKLAADIIRQIREFVQKGDAERSPVDLNRAVSNVHALVMPEARRHDVAIELQLANQLPVIKGNMIQLEQVILNLVRNGIDAMDSVQTGDRRLRIVTRREGASVRVSVVDSGEGISEESLPRIFDAFYSTKSDGMGIGLSISRSIVESHQGRIAATPLPAGGTEFSIELPALEAV
jgi:C4-dicarboxylate-specific signal transduction histidine kinase